MKCLFCRDDDTQVIDSRVNEDGRTIRRRRECKSCEKRFTTYERAELTLPYVIKQDGKREEFSREKLLHSLTRALHKRPVPVKYVDNAVEDILSILLAKGEREINSRDLGESVMYELKKLDKVAYIRFASVYRSFSDLDDFSDAIKDLD
ncbi:transcriptional regulator NrdR [Methylophilaceae bacterium]|jgi:transcriptional repressor NrdR|nr:transcriptional regulator NrdR [Methylophilaceae bacterium]|tara:strand:- start:388 stop:834 length:447 start_codon:yes stop_codon:yes gene_type:complete